MFFIKDDWNIEGASNLLLKLWGFYIGYWGRVLYLFLGIQVTITALLIMANNLA